MTRVERVEVVACADCGVDLASSEAAVAHLEAAAAALGHVVAARAGGLYGCSCAPGAGDWWSGREGALEHALVASGARASHALRVEEREVTVTESE